MVPISRYKIYRVTRIRYWAGSDTDYYNPDNTKWSISKQLSLYTDSVLSL